MQLSIRFVLIMLMLYLPAATAFAVTPDEIKTTIESRYRITTPGFFGDYRQIGSVLVVLKSGLRADRPRKLFNPNLISNGRIMAAGGGDVPLGNNVDGSLKAGDRLYLYGIHTGDDYVELALFTVNHFVITGMKGSIPLQASVRFQYDMGLSAVSAKQVVEDIGTWFKTEREHGTYADAVPDGEVKVIKTIRITGPEGASKPTRTIQLGQTPEEVAAILGEPEKKILLGAKTVFVYKDLKVVFIDGKLSDAY